MGGWILYHAISTILVGTERFKELADFLNHCKATNDLKMHLLKSQTHMEWFSHPLHTNKFAWEFWYAVNGPMDPPSCHYLPSYLLVQNLEILQNSWVTAGLQIISRCIGWGSKPIWNGFHIYSIHIKGAWEYSYGVDGQIGQPSCHYHHTYWRWIHGVCRFHASH